METKTGIFLFALVFCTLFSVNLSGQPGVGFIGEYRLVFIMKDAGDTVKMKQVRVTILH